ncbi:MAG: tRNA guanosine(34) transglycosylase Tgt [Oligoflexia bacterium]|nr:tRNA guanosine(34) transglycosylase Tgt [Oligoflexia bacterium]
MAKFKFSLIKNCLQTRARRGQVQTPHGAFDTPAFMPVGTLATVKSLSPDEIKNCGAQIVLGNTYHLLLRPGPEVFRHFGGIQKFMNWNGPVLTDSGGFQIFSLPLSRKITEEGAEFASYVEGKTHFLTPEHSIEIQSAIGSDIMMVLDECVPSTSPHAQALAAMERTHRWALRSLAARQDADRQALFAIVQGAIYPDLRRQSADFLTQHPFDGFAIGGLAVGESKAEREDHTELVTELLPQDRPRYLMGVGTPEDLLEAVSRGVDMFDCIIPTKLAQQGIVFTSSGAVRLDKIPYRLSEVPLDSNCDCWSCKSFSRGYIHHLIRCHETLGWRACAFHNTYFYQKLMAEIRRSIEAGTFAEFKRRTLEAWKSGEALEKEMVSRESAIIMRERKKHSRHRIQTLSGDLTH